MSDFHKKWKEFLAEGRRKKGAAVQWPPQELVDQNLLSQHPEGEDDKDIPAQPEKKWNPRAQKSIDKVRQKWADSYSLSDDPSVPDGASAQVWLKDIKDRDPSLSDDEAREYYSGAVEAALNTIMTNQPHIRTDPEQAYSDRGYYSGGKAYVDRDYEPGAAKENLGFNKRDFEATLSHEIAHAADYGIRHQAGRDQKHTNHYRQIEKFETVFPGITARQDTLDDDKVATDPEEHAHSLPEAYADLIDMRVFFNNEYKKGRRSTPHMTAKDLRWLTAAGHLGWGGGASPRTTFRDALNLRRGGPFNIHQPGQDLKILLKTMKNPDLSNQEIADILNSIAMTDPEESHDPSMAEPQSMIAESQNKGFHDKWRQFLREEEEFQKNVVRPRLKRNRSALIDSGAHDHNGGGPSGAKPRPRGDLPHDAGPLKEGLRPRLLREISEDEVEHIRAAIDEMGPEDLAFNDAFQGDVRKVIAFPTLDSESELGQFLAVFDKMEYQVDWEKGILTATRVLKDSSVENLVSQLMGGPETPIKTRKIQMKVGKFLKKLYELTSKKKELGQKVFDHLESIGYKGQPDIQYVQQFTGKMIEAALDEQEQKRYQQITDHLDMYVGEHGGEYAVKMVKDPEIVNKMAQYWQQNADYIKKNLKDAETSQYSIIISRDPIDILRMSDFNKITSCHSPPSRSGGESYYKCAVAEAHGHGAIAYVVDTKELLQGTDTDNIEEAEIAINDAQEIFYDDIRGSHIGIIEPISRTRLRKFVYDTPDPEGGYDIGTQLAVPEKRVYGKQIPGFVSRVVQWARENQKEALDNMPADAYGDGIDLNKFTLVGASYEDTAGHKGRRELMVQLTGRPNEDFDGQVGQDSGPEDELDTSMFTAGQIEAAQARVDEIVDEWNGRYQAAEIEASVEDDDGQVIIMLKAWMKVQWGVEEWNKLPASTSARWAVSELNDLGWAWADESAAWLRREGDPRFNNTQAVTLGFRIDPENIPEWTGMPFTADPEEVEDFGVAVNKIDDMYDGIKHYLTRHYKMEGSMVGGRFLNMAIEISNNDIDPYEWTLELDDKYDPDEATIIIGQVEFFFDAKELQWNPKVLQEVLDSRDFKLAIRNKMLAAAKKEVQTEYNVDIYDMGTGAMPLNDGVNYEFAFVVSDEDPDEVINLFQAAVWQPGTVDDEDKLRDIFLGTLETIRRLRMPTGMKGSEPIEQLWDDEPDPPPAQKSEEENLPSSRLNENRNMHRMYKKWRTFIK